MTAASTPNSRDQQLLYASAFVRAFATGMLGVLMGVQLARQGFDASRIGVIVACGLGGAAAASVVATFGADRIGRRRLLVALAVLGACGALGLASASHFAWALAAATFGMLNGMGRDRGAALILEQAILPGLTTDATRTRAFAFYNMAQDIGHALGGLAAGIPALLAAHTTLGEAAAGRVMVIAYAPLLLLALPLYAMLSPAIEVAKRPPQRRLDPQTRRLLWRISSLFALDSLGGGFLTTALLAYFFFRRFGVGEGTIAILFFLSRIMNAVSHLGAAWLAKRIGLVNTMVFTHIPSSLLLVTVGLATSFPVAAVLFVLREGLVEMDVPTRQSYVMAVVPAEDRTLASGVTGLVRTAAWAVAPGFAGWVMQHVSFAVPLYTGAGMKIVYDLLLWRAFRGVKPPEERA